MSEPTEMEMNYRGKPFDVEIFANTVEKNYRAKKFRGPDSPLYSTLYPMICIVKIFGLGPYEFVKDNLAPSNSLLIFSFLFLGIYSFIIHQVYLRFTGVKRDKPVLGWTETLKVAVNFFVAMYDILHAIFTRNTFVKIWNTFQDYDDTVRKLGYPHNERRTAIMAWTVLIIQASIWTLVNQMGMYAFLESWTYNAGFMCVYLGTCTAVYKFVGVAFILAERFNHLTQIAMENLPPLPGHPTSGKRVSKRTIQNLHNELMAAGETLNSMYSWSLFFWLGNLSVHSVSDLYFVIDWLILTAWTSVHLLLAFCLIAWLSAFIMQLLILHIVCDYTTRQASSINVVFINWNFRLLQQNPERADVPLHLLDRKLQFSAAGCFQVDLHLLHSITATLSTYLVIILQFSE